MGSKKQSKEDITKNFKSKNRTKPIMKKKDSLKPKFDIKKLKEALNLKPINNEKEEITVEKQFINYKEEFAPLWSKYKARNFLHISSNQNWTDQLIEETVSLTKIDSSIIKRIRILAKQIYDDDVKHFLQSQEKNNNENQHIQKTVLTHGTSKDKIAAYTVRCLDSPVYCIKDLLSLINLVDRKSKANKVEAVGHLRTLFKKTYLLNGHVAKRFENHNFKVLLPLIKDSPEKVEKQLVLWHFDDQVRYAYLQLIRKIDEICLDVQPKSKAEAIKSLMHFLYSHPKQDIEITLSILINKLGDTIGGEVSYKINSLINKFPEMKVITVSAVKELMTRSNVNKKAQYLGLCCLCNILFRHNEQKLIEDVITIYINFFVEVSEKGEVDSKFMSILLRGLNRAIPYYNSKKLSFLEEKMNSLYTLCHFVNFNICTQTLQLLFNITCKNDSRFTDRFYNILYEKVLDPGFGKSSSVTQFLNLVYRVLAEDHNAARVCAFSRRLLQVSHYLPSNIICGILYLLSEVIKDNVNIENFNYLLTKQSKPTQNTILDNLDDDDDQEYYSDLDTDGEEQTSDEEKKKNGNKICSVKIEPIQKSENTWMHRENIKSEVKDEGVRTTQYLPNHRNPKFCGANFSDGWEITSLTKNYHPSVAKFATDLIEKNCVEYSGDPLLDFTLKKFLDRFSIRNPKKIKEGKRISIFGKRSHALPEGIKKLSIESEAFKSLKVESVPVDDMFCYKYMTQYKRLSKGKRSKRDDSDSVNDEEFEDYLDRMKQLEYFGGMLEDDVDLDDIDFASSAKNDDENQNPEENMMEDDNNLGEDDKDNIREDDEYDMGEDDEYGMEDDDDFENFEDDLLAQDQNDGSDFEDVDFSDGDDDFEVDEEEEEDSNNTFSVDKMKSRKFSANNWQNMLVDADKFSHLLESGNDFKDPLAGTSEQVKGSNANSMKQIKWEKSQTANGKKIRSQGRKTNKKSKK